ncbi:MAG: M28 family peptidase [bacterium]
MKTRSFIRRCVLFLTLSFIVPYWGMSQDSDVLRTPLSQEVLDLLTNEISGQIIFNNEVILAGAPWIRAKSEFSDTFFESQRIFEMVKEYGIETVRLDRYESDRTFEYAFEGEFWIVKPERRLVARLDADAALIARGSSSVDTTAELVYIPPLRGKEIEEWVKAGVREEYNGKVALMWSHPRGTVADALDAAGIVGVISFYAQDWYFDPDQVIYASGSYSGKKNLKFGFTVSWRQWSELLEDVEMGRKLTVRCKARVESFQDKFENVFSWIPGTEPDKKGVIFSAHLFEGYTKRGANDNMSGCVIQLEILRALSKLVSEGLLPQPRRNIYFLWMNEISGTYEHFKQHPGFAEKLSANINMDMVGEALRKNNAVFTMSECPSHLPCYLDGLGQSMMNYVWRTNDIVYLPDSPRGRRGQFFPKPMWEKNGSRDAFRFFIHRATGGSDHICFNNPSVAVPGIELFTWPDQWYHTDMDTPDKSDPTQMKRVAFIGAAMAYAAANCTDDVLKGLLDDVSAFGYERMGKREIPEAMRMIDRADAKDFQSAFVKAHNLVRFAAERETGAVGSTEEIYSGSEDAERLLHARVKQWELYGEGLENSIVEYGRVRASDLGVKFTGKPKPIAEEKTYARVIPSIHADVKGQEFYVERSPRFEAYRKEHPDVLKDVKLNRFQTTAILNFVNGKRSVTDIRNAVVAETGRDLSFDALMAYLNVLKEIGWIAF